MNRIFRSFLNTNFALRSGAAAALATLAFASAPALAQYNSTCSGCTPSAPPIGASFQLGGGFGGISEAIASGNGPTKTSSIGGLDLSAAMNAVSDGCPGGCGDVSFSGQGSAFQKNMAEALSHGAGSSAVQTLSNGAIRLTFGQ